LKIWHFPFAVRDGISAWNTRTVPVGKRFARLAALCATFVFLDEPRICGINGNDSGRVEGWFLGWLGLWIDWIRHCSNASSTLCSRDDSAVAAGLA